MDAIDYLQKIRCARSLDMIALYIRAFGTRVSVTLSMLTGYEQNAQTIERCDNLKQARRLLKEMGY